MDQNSENIVLIYNLRKARSTFNVDAIFEFFDNLLYAYIICQNNNNFQ